MMATRNKMSTQSHSENSEKLYTIGTVSQLTGVGSITLRAWERRYELINPVRKESGHRLYTRQHIEQINRITKLTAQGIRISQITPEMLEPEQPGEEQDENAIDLWRDYKNNMIEAIVKFDETRLEEIYNEVLSFYPIGLVTRLLLKPLLKELGQRWEAEQQGVAEEHFFAFYLRNKLGARFHHRPRHNTGKLLLLAGLPGEYHEIAILLFALAANEQGFQLLTLGANMPMDELARVAAETRPDAVVLSGAIMPQASVVNKELPALVNSVSVPVFVGGQASVLAVEAIGKAGAESLGPDMELGLRRLKDQLG